jgi:acyl phosphate:glycerol-3-phosphate acyltransferase
MPELTSSTNVLLAVAVVAYLLGSIPFGLIVTRAMGLGDLRQIGSGNIGATNVLRTGNKRAALATLLLDAAKGAVAVLGARWLTGAEDAAQVAALAAFAGHILPVWLRFRGGKGVATFLGVMLALNPMIGGAIAATWLVVAALSRLSSLAAIAAAGSSSIWAFLLGLGPLFVLSLVFTALIYWRHGENIGRLRAGTEPKIGAKT